MRIKMFILSGDKCGGNVGGQVFEPNALFRASVCYLCNKFTVFVVDGETVARRLELFRVELCVRRYGEIIRARRGDRRQQQTEQYKQRSSENFHCGISPVRPAE